MKTTTSKGYLSGMVKLAIVDDNLRIAHDLQRELAAMESIESVVIFSSGSSFLQSINTTTPHPDVVLMDISMDVRDEGIYTTRLLHEKYPGIKVVMFTVSDDDENIFEAFKSGSVGYLLKNERIPFIHKTIIDVYQGGALMSPGVALKAIRYLSQENIIPSEDYRLSTRELEILKLISKGLPYKAIADQLFISAETVKKHVSNTFKKLQVKNKVEALNKVKSLLK